MGGDDSSELQMKGAIMSKLFLPAYWPLFKTTELRRFDYSDPTGTLEPISSVFSYDKATDSMRYDDFNGDESWRDTWYYQYRVGFGIAEWQDEDVMPAGWMTTVFGKKKRVVMDPPIGWGEFLNVGETYTNYPKMVPWRCMPPQFASGKNVVTIKKHITDGFDVGNSRYHDVIQMLYQQSWNNNPPVGANYWMALGVGPVAIQWVAPTGQMSAILPARVTSFNV
jgi:hypothetical protein